MANKEIDLTNFTEFGNYHFDAPYEVFVNKNGELVAKVENVISTTDKKRYKSAEVHFPNFKPIKNSSFGTGRMCSGRTKQMSEVKGELTGKTMWYLDEDNRITKVYVVEPCDDCQTLLIKYWIIADDGSWHYPKIAIPSELHKNLASAFKAAQKNSERKKKYQRMADENWYSDFINRYNTDKEFQGWFDQKFEEDGGSKTNEQIASEVQDILITVGQHDHRFKLGETIKYSPTEVYQILLGYIAEDET